MIKREKLSSSPKRRHKSFSTGSRTFKRKRDAYESDTTGSDRGSRNIYIFPVPITYEKRDLKNMFERFGEVVSVKVMADRGDMRGIPCFVDFAHATSATEAKKTYDGKPLKQVFEDFNDREDKEVLIVSFSKGQRKRTTISNPPKRIKAERRKDLKRSAKQDPRVLSKTNVYICPVSQEVTERILEKTFSRFGRIRKTVVLNRKGRKLGRSTGHPAFVEFHRPVSAKRAIEAFNGLSASQVFEGYRGNEVLAVRYAELTSAVRARRDAVRDAGGNRIYVFPLPQYVKERDLTRMFGKCGEITHIHIITKNRSLDDPDAGIPAFVDFEDPEAALRAVQELNGVRLEDLLESYRGDDKLVVRFPSKSSRNDHRPPRDDTRRRGSRNEHEYRNISFDPSLDVSGPSEMDFSTGTAYAPSPVRQRQSRTPTRSPHYRNRASFKRATPPFKRGTSVDTIDFDQDNPEELELAQREYELLASLAAVRKQRLAMKNAKKGRHSRRL